MSKLCSIDSAQFLAVENTGGIRVLRLKTEATSVFRIGVKSFDSSLLKISLSVRSTGIKAEDLFDDLGEVYISRNSTPRGEA